MSKTYEDCTLYKAGRYQGIFLMCLSLGVVTLGGILWPDLYAPYYYPRWYSPVAAFGVAGLYKWAWWLSIKDYNCKPSDRLFTISEPTK